MTSNSVPVFILVDFKLNMTVSHYFPAQCHAHSSGVNLRLPPPPTMKGFVPGRDTIQHDHWSRTLFWSRVGSRVGSEVEQMRLRTPEGPGQQSGCKNKQMSWR